MSKPISAIDVNGHTENPFPEVFHKKMGESVYRGLSDQFGVQKFGVNLEVIKPGGSSGLKHWHTESEEFVYVLSGSLILLYGEAAYEMAAGDCMGFKANEGKGHRLVNRSNEDASFIVVGSRVESDQVIYDEDDFQWVLNENGEWVATKKNGEAY